MSEKEKEKYQRMGDADRHRYEVQCRIARAAGCGGRREPTGWGRKRQQKWVEKVGEGREEVV